MDQNAAQGSERKNSFAALSGGLAAASFAGMLTIFNCGRHSFYLTGALVCFSIGVPALSLTTLSLRNCINGFCHDEGPNTVGVWFAVAGIIANFVGIGFLFWDYSKLVASSFEVAALTVIIWINVVDGRATKALGKQQQEAERKTMAGQTANR